MSTTPATIAFVHRGRDWIRGSEQCLLDLAARIDRTRFRPLVICEQPTLARAAASLGVAVEQLDPADDWGVGRPTARGSTRARLRHVLREHEASLVHVNVTSVLPIVLPVARALRLPIVAHLHLSIENVHTRVHELIHQADVTVGVAEHVVAPLRQDGGGADRARVILNGVDADRLETAGVSGLREELGLPLDAFVAVSVGSLIHRKGHDVTVRGVAAARARGVDARLVVCGDGEESGALRAEVEVLGLTPYVHFLGYRGDVGAVLRAVADVFVTSAREEMLPLNVLEAQWLGVPVIASDIPAHHESMAVGVTGLLVPLDDPAALGETLAALAAAPARLAAFAAAGPAVARERFGIEQYVASFESLYAELLARPRSSYGWVRGFAWPRLYTRYAVGIAGRRVHRLLRSAGPNRGGPVVR